MSATYNELHPTNKDRVRAALGDTDVTAALLTDEHINAMLTEYGYPLGQARLAHELWARFVQEPVRISSFGDAFDLSKMIDVWRSLAAPWLAYEQSQAAQAAGALASSGISFVDAVYRDTSTNTDEFSP